MRWLWLLMVPLALAALYGVHRLLCGMEARGWIYYRRAGSGGSVSRAVGDLQSMLEPGQRHAVEERRAERSESRENGEPPESEERNPPS